MWGFSRPTSVVFTRFGEVLVTGEMLFRLQATNARNPVRLSSRVPPLAIALLDLPMHVQGMCADATGGQLSNALDVLLGQ